MIICLETATSTCSVAINEGEKTLALRECKGQNAHSEKITIFIQQLLDEVQIRPEQLDAVAVSKGPGSYTGLRIGVSTAKGMCYAANLPLLAIDTLHAMAYGMAQRLGDELQPTDLLIPMIDARRMEVYCAVFDANLNKLHDTQAVVFNAPSSLFSLNSKLSILNSKRSPRLWLFGDGAPKLKPLFADHPEVHIVDDLLPSAAFMAPLAEKAWKDRDFVDVAYFEPFYLKDFVAGKPHVNGIEN